MEHNAHHQYGHGYNQNAFHQAYGFNPHADFVGYQQEVINYEHGQGDG